MKPLSVVKTKTDTETKKFLIPKVVAVAKIKSQFEEPSKEVVI
jgi:hypothetical protein